MNKNLKSNGGTDHDKYTKSSRIHTFADGSTKLAESLPAPDYIQHNLPYGTGRAALISSVSDLASAPVKTTVKNIRAFEDGDKVFLHRRDIRRRADCLL